MLVSRLICHGITYDIQLLLDVNTSVFPCKVSDRLGIKFVYSIDLQGKLDSDDFSFPKGVKQSVKYRIPCWISMNMPWMERFLNMTSKLIKKCN